MNKLLPFYSQTMKILLKKKEILLLNIKRIPEKLGQHKTVMQIFKEDRG